MHIFNDHWKWKACSILISFGFNVLSTQRFSFEIEPVEASHWYHSAKFVHMLENCIQAKCIMDTWLLTYLDQKYVWRTLLRKYIIEKQFIFFTRLEKVERLNSVTVLWNLFWARYDGNINGLMISKVKPMTF